MNHILNLLLTGACLIYSIPHGSAQSLLISSDSVFQESCVSFPPPFEAVYVVNNTDEDILLRWNRTEYYNPYDGSYFLIIHGKQYLPNTYQGYVNIPARDSAEVLFHLFTDFMWPGDTAFLQITVYDDADSINTARILTAIKYCPLSTSTTDPGNNPAIKIYPNPVYDEATITLPESTPATSLQLYSITGDIIREIPVSHHEITFSREGLPGGMYAVALMHDGKMVGVSKMILMD
jgi:hypothetical protein